MKRFGNYGKFAKRFGVVTNNKHGYWNEDTILNRLSDIHKKYSYLPTSIEIRNKKLSKSDALFIGIVDGVKSVFGNKIHFVLRILQTILPPPIFHLSVLYIFKKNCQIKNNTN